VAGCGAPTPETSYVAEAAGVRLSAEELAQIMAPAEPRPSERERALLLAELWVDYTLLSTAAVEDSTFAHLRLGGVAEQRTHAMMQDRLRDSIVLPDRRLSEAEVRSRYEREAPGSEIRTRQILLAVAHNASEARRQSARDSILALHARIVEGADFEALAREYSQDPRTAPQGGDMGFFGRGEMMPPFEAAAYALEPGEVSAPVETSYGWHLIRLEERRTPTLAQFRQLVQRQSLVAYVDSLEGHAELQIGTAAVETVRRIARDLAVPGPETAPPVRYRNGTVTVQDVQRYIAGQRPHVRAEIADASDDRIVLGVLRPLARQKLLDEEARRHGLDPGPEDIEAEMAKIRQELTDAARSHGLLTVRGDEAADAGRAVATEQAVRELIRQVAQDQRDVRFLGPVSQVLREHYRFRVRDDMTLLVVRRLEELRQERETR
jgi:hypothetical protein